MKKINIISGKSYSGNKGHRTLNESRIYLDLPQKELRYVKSMYSWHFQISVKSNFLLKDFASFQRELEFHMEVERDINEIIESAGEYVKIGSYVLEGRVVHDWYLHDPFVILKIYNEISGLDPRILLDGFADTIFDKEWHMVDFYFKDLKVSEADKLQSN